MNNHLKDPSAIKDFGFIWTDWLDGDAISESTWILPDGITEQSSSHTSSIATIWLAGGTAGNDYIVTNQITTDGGRTDQRSLKIQVREL